jgi:stearoyl-CoA desaturase (delta-9 desaturase)
LIRSLEHIGFPISPRESFARSGSVEPVWHYVARILFAAGFWGGLAWLAFGVAGVEGWFAAVFLYTFLVRDFNYRGHGGYFGEHPQGVPLNQFFYGLIAGEWHENHHDWPRLARSGFKWWQLDAPYWIIWAMHRVGIVAELNLPAANPRPTLELKTAR